MYCRFQKKKRLWGATWGCEQKVKKPYSRKYWFWDMARVHLQCNGFVNLYRGPTKNHSSTSPATTSHQALQTEVTPGTVLPTRRTNQKVHILFLILPGGEELHCHHNGLTGRQQWKNIVESKSLLRIWVQAWVRPLWALRANPSTTFSLCTAGLKRG